MEKSLKILIVDVEGEQERYARFIRDSFPELDRQGKLNFILAQYEAEIAGDVSDVDIVASQVPLVKTLPQINNLKWAMTMTAGYEHHLKAGALPPGLPLTNAPGIMAIPMAEYNIAVMIMFAKEFPRIMENQKKAKFERFLGQELGGKTLGIIGLGGIGQATAEKAKAFGMHVIGTKRHIAPVPFVDEVLSADDYESLLERSDFVILSCPANEETIGMMNEKQFKLMKSSAYLINVGRGSLIVKEALHKALKGKWIAGAALDVFWEYPLPSYLPEDDELWSLDNVIISPHIGGHSDQYAIRASKLLAENIKRYLAGEKLQNIVAGDWRESS